jgi:hypothetical protein
MASYARGVDRCITMAGASAVLAASPLQRRLPDINAAGQHKGDRSAGPDVDFEE